MKQIDGMVGCNIPLPPAGGGHAHLLAIIEKTKQTKKGRKKLEEKFTTIYQTDV